jgi:hypothetical protein
MQTELVLSKNHIFYIALKSECYDIWSFSKKSKIWPIMQKIAKDGQLWHFSQNFEFLSI